MAFYDVAIIGGGPAGLTAAATLARQLHTAVVFDSNKYRNAVSKEMHMVPSLEGKDPAEFRREAREGITSRYSTVEFQDVAVSKVQKKGDAHFVTTDAAGKTWRTRKVLLAIGSTDVFPRIEGFNALWGTRIFHCLFCKGYEDRGAASAGVLAVAPVALPTDMLVMVAVHAAANAAQLAGSVTLYANGDKALAAGLKAAARKQARWTVEPRKIKRLVAAAGEGEGEGQAEGDSVVVEFEDGSSRKEKFLVNQPLTVPGGPFVGQLGLATSPLGDILAEPPFHQTSVRGVFAAGDCMTPNKVVPTAIASGSNAAVGASTQLQSEKYGFKSVV
ncbi:putative thioredoxin reductase [Diaporthe ampelina]|uniref:Putative thioredoxin reductase n=1 Tax=Diaporthe ampelina TaxID=1214573 RepID=A0A0G2FMA4_9PEZI|nr:putative thioredoxin reductase [Diaporthe ampelina]